MEKCSLCNESLGYAVDINNNIARSDININLICDGCQEIGRAHV